MNAIILAAGYGTRFGNKDDTCKSFLFLKKKLLINRALDQFLDQRIRSIHIVHNAKWAKSFRQWKGGLINSEPGKNQIPYIRLHNDGSKSLSTARGALGSLYFALTRMRERRDFFLLCVDTVCTYSVSEFIRWCAGGGRIVLALRRVRDGFDSSRYGSLEVDPDGTVHEFKEKLDTGSDHVWIGPAYIPASAIDLFFEFYAKEGGDNLGDFFAWYNKREKIATWLPYRGEALDIGNQDDLIIAEKSMPIE
jgi:NDP-sugar pyrophosphorylase family protein